MIDYGWGYRSLCQSSTQQELSFIQKNIESYPLLEKLLGFTFALNANLVPIYEQTNEGIKDPKHLNISDKLAAEQSVVALCTLNLHSIWHAMRPLEQNSIHNCANMARPVYEAIPKMFYILRHPEHVWEILLREEFGLWLPQKRFSDEINQIGISDGSTQNPQADLPDTEHRYLEHYLAHNSEGKKLQDRIHMTVSKSSYKRFRGKYNNEWFRREIYTEKSLRTQNATYASLSVSSHANIVRSRTPIEYNPVLSPQIFKTLTDLAFFNLYVWFNASHQTIAKIGEWENAKKFIVDAQQELKFYYEMTHLYPDVPEYVENLNLYPDIARVKNPQG